MEIVPLTSERAASWNSFCQESPEAWFWHTTPWIDYKLAYRPEMEQESFSFMCKERDRVLAVVPLIAGGETIEGDRVRMFTYTGDPLPSPALAADISGAPRERLLETIFRVIEGLAVELGIRETRLQLAPLAPAYLQPRYPVHNYLTRFGYLDCSNTTQVIDLRLGAAELWEGVRRDHQRSIERSRERIHVRLLTGDAVSGSLFDSYRLMHGRAAGQVTRPLRTFEMMHEWVRSAAGFLAQASLADGTPVGYEVFHGNKGAVYSMSACNEPGYGELPIRHLIQWEAILWMKSKGFDFYEVGNQQFGVLPYDFPDKKKLDISLFKAGFGGITVPVLRGERFHSETYWQRERARREALFAASFRWDAPSEPERARRLMQLRNEAIHGKTVRSAETEAIPESVRALASDVVSRNPDVAKSHRNGSTKAVAFLVGVAMPRAPRGIDPRVVRRAIEEFLLQPPAA